MSHRAQDFKPLLAPSAKRLEPGIYAGPASLSSMIRDNFTISTWLCLGASAQILLYLITNTLGFRSLALLPALAILAYRTLDSCLITIGWKHNTYLDNIIQKKISTAFPDELGHYGNKPANNDIVVFLIGTRVNHAMGLAAPGVLEMGGYMTQMCKDLNTHAEEFGFLGMTSWLNSTDRATNSEILEVCYFRSVEGLQKFAHSDYHRKAWDWWNKTIKQHPHLAIFHETYHVPKGHWESIYVNSHVSGLNATSHKFTDEMTGTEMYASPVVDASKGLLKTSAGRMARSQGDDHDAYGEDPY